MRRKNPPKNIVPFCTSRMIVRQNRDGTWRVMCGGFLVSDDYPSSDEAWLTAYWYDDAYPERMVRRRRPAQKKIKPLRLVPDTGIKFRIVSRTNEGGNAA
jgi:hypothetical protein